MRPKLILLLMVACGAIASSAYLIIKSSNTKPSCQNCQKKKPAVKAPPAESGGGDEMFNASFNHFIVSTVK
jgi:hypothetical protein